MRCQRKIGLMVMLVFVITLFAPAALYADTVDTKAEAYVLMDADSGKVLLSSNEHKRLAPASMTKLMTLILALEDLEKGKVGLKDKVVTSEEAWKMGGSQIYLEPGEEMTYEDMLISIAVGSANDACVAVAEHLEGTHKNFVERMNQEAKMLGLKNTHFVNANGLSAPNHYTSAYDMAVIARHALSNPRILEYSSIKEYKLRQGEFVLYNTNKLLWWYEGADGFKTGWTNEAKYCLTATAKRDNLRLIAVVMGVPEKNGNFQDTMKLFNYGFARYTYKSISPAGSACGAVKVGKGLKDSVEVIAEEDVGSIVKKGDEKKISSELSLPAYVDAPVKKGQKLGEYLVFNNGQLYKKVNLVANEDVPRSGIIKEILKMLAETYLL
jgi:D-alanyl-D-alanine carboxypeptidase (penicillin-binding protein 5/6)